MWNRTESSLPQENKVVMTISASGQEAKLFRQGSLWFVESGSMYVYYTPIMWREI